MDDLFSLTKKKKNQLFIPTFHPKITHPSVSDILFSQMKAVQKNNRNKTH